MAQEMRTVRRSLLSETARSSALKEQVDAEARAVQRLETAELEIVSRGEGEDRRAVAALESRLHAVETAAAATKAMKSKSDAKCVPPTQSQPLNSRTRAVVRPLQRISRYKQRRRPEKTEPSRHSGHPALPGKMRVFPYKCPCHVSLLVKLRAIVSDGVIGDLRVQTSIIF